MTPTAAERGAQILVVDDDPYALATIEALLNADGYRLRCVSSGQDALEHLRHEKVSLIICDLLMPRCDGLHLCRAVRAHPDWRFTPIILVSSLDQQDEMVKGLESGADEYLAKPLQRVVLRARVRALLRVRDHYDQLRASADLPAMLAARRQRLVEEAGLTEREREVLEHLLQGRAHVDIGLALGISARTCKFHQANILAKFGAESRHELTRLFI